METPDRITFQNGSVPADALEVSFIRASGPGGQNVNKVATAAQLRLDVNACPDIGPAMKMRLRKLAGRRMTSDGVIVITARQFRTQEQNRADALERLAGMLQEAAVPPPRRRPTRPGRGAKERRLKQKKERAGIKKKRGRVRIEG